MIKVQKGSNHKNKSEIESKIVTVGFNQTRRLFIAVILSIFLVFGIYYFYFNTNKVVDVKKIHDGEEFQQNFHELSGELHQVPDNDIIIRERMITDLPDLPPLVAPKTIPEIKYIEREEKEEDIKEVASSMQSNRNISLKQNLNHVNNDNNKILTSLPIIGKGIGYPRDRRSVQMLIISNNSIGKVNNDEVNTNFLSDTPVQHSIATKIGNLEFMITQGKIIDVILETAINSDLQGMLRAVVSSDVYSDVGDRVLIPKGSRLIGEHSFNLNIARAYVNIKWNRIILPHGIDIIISSPATDELGRSGVAGVVDNKIRSALFSSILLASLSTGSAIAAEKVSTLVDKLTFMDQVKSISTSMIDFYSLKNSVKIGSHLLPSSDKWKLGIESIIRIKRSKNEEDLLRIFREEISKILGIDESSLNINLNDVSKLLQKFFNKNKSIYEEVINKSITDFSKDMRDIVNRSIDKNPTVYIDQGTALKVFVNQDIAFPPHSILN